MQANSLNSRFQQIKSNKIFEIFVISIIVFSALVVGAKTYDIPPAVEQAVVVLDWLITVIFVIEITIRFLAEDRKSRFFRSPWNLFDTLIVLISIIPIENGELAVIGRLVRIFRVLRMVSIVPELRVLIVSLMKALPQLGYVMLLMFIIYYIYAAIGSTFFEEINPQLWGDVAVSMLTLFRVMTFEDWTDVMYETMTVYSLSWIYFLSFIFFTAFAFLNMVIGIVVSVMEKEHQALAAANGEDGSSELAAIRQELSELKALIKSQRGDFS
ncbi:ion transporter [Teredinibacter turnerae]|uniref:Kef-type K+ transport system, NAD-binding component n=1 Tax=Teredinibacter turnerae (strain ATCC 39867 / T7901) TaxID=377629 RepID=C5BI16_TERTT|nr:ion transporter [Teredinibacter turnerae]ACR13546.1 Kef-type K+ transport system, NAD-binding component [Teredinibacter turnerae T7901]